VTLRLVVLTSNITELMGEILIAMVQARVCQWLVFPIHTSLFLALALLQRDRLHLALSEHVRLVLTPVRTLLV
jgi:hypothetical protein